jgi:hypothetical protein
LTFGTLLSSQGTDASFDPVSGPSGRFPPVLHFLTQYCFPYFVFPTLPDSFRLLASGIPVAVGGPLPFGDHYVSRFPVLLIIKRWDRIPDMPKSVPVRDRHG